VEDLITLVAVVTVTHQVLVGIVVPVGATEQTVVNNTQVESVVMDQVVTSTFMEVVETVTVPITHMVTIPLDEDIGVEVNQRHTFKETMDTITNLMQHGVLVETELERVTEVLEDVKE
jgi:hypothetical protein